MSDNRMVAGNILKEAWETIGKKRPGVHGSAELSFEMIGDFWTIYLRHARKTRGNDTVRAEDVAEMMSMLKKARKMYGDPMNVDNDVDDLGYSALAAMLRLPDITQSKDTQIDKELEKLDVDQNGGEKSEHEHVWGYRDQNTEECIVEGCGATRKAKKVKSNAATV